MPSFLNIEHIPHWVNCPAHSFVFYYSLPSMDPILDCAFNFQLLGSHVSALCAVPFFIQYLSDYTEKIVVVTH